MGSFLSYLMQILLLTFAPFLVCGVGVSLARSLFIHLSGEDCGGRTLRRLALYPSTPLRVLACTLSAIFFGQRVSDVCFLNLHTTDGELGFVERSYNPRNPIAILGNFFYALAPLGLSLLCVLGVLAACFGGVLGGFVSEIEEISAHGGDFFEYAAATVRILPAMRGAPGGVLVKLLGCVLILALCMGASVSITELVESFGGLVLYGALCALFAGVLLLFDPRVGRNVLGALHSFAALVVALSLVVWLAVAILLAMSALIFLYRFLFGPPPLSTAVQIYREEQSPTDGENESYEPQPQGEEQ